MGRKFETVQGENQALWRRRKSVQASRKCTFAPLAGAKAPDPYAAFGRKVARPRVAEKESLKNNCQGQVTLSALGK